MARSRSESAEKMKRLIQIATVQFSCSKNISANSKKAETFVREAAKRVRFSWTVPVSVTALTSCLQGADIVVLPELFLDQYFCKEHKTEHFSTALSSEIESNPYLAHFSNLAKELNVVIPFSFFERANQVYYNSVVMLDSDGAVLGKYRKSHIPTGPGMKDAVDFAISFTDLVVQDIRRNTIFHQVTLKRFELAEKKMILRVTLTL